MPARWPDGKGGKRARDEPDMRHTRDVRYRGPPDLRQLPNAWWRGNIETDRAGNACYWHQYLDRWLYIDHEDGEFYCGYNHNTGGYNRIVTMTWAIDRFSGRVVRRLTPNFYRFDFDPNESWS